jgi:hypothetical protein
MRNLKPGPDADAAALHRKLTTMPHIPSKGQMGNPELIDEHLANVIAYIMSMRQIDRSWPVPPVCAKRKDSPTWVCKLSFRLSKTLPH